MQDGGKFEVEHPFLSFLNRLIALYWLFLLLVIPALAFVRIGKAYRRRRGTKDKHEKKYWSNQILQYWCILYIAVWLYYHLLQDFMPVSFEVQATITYWFDFVMGIPGMFWYIFTDKAVAERSDPTQFVFVTFWAVLIILAFNLILDYMKVYGHLDDEGVWIAPDKVNRKRNAQFDKEEQQSRALSKLWYAHKIAHPQNHPDWKRWSKAEKQRAVQDWEVERDELWKRIEQCPRASYYDAK
jgi:hypothetical protein